MLDSVEKDGTEEAAGMFVTLLVSSRLLWLVVAVPLELAVLLASWLLQCASLPRLRLFTVGAVQERVQQRGCTLFVTIRASRATYLPMGVAAIGGATVGASPRTDTRSARTSIRGPTTAAGVG